LRNTAGTVIVSSANAVVGMGGQWH